MEAIAQFAYCSIDVLPTERERVKRTASLMKATLMDSVSGSEVILVVRDQHSTKKLRSRVIATGNNRVMLERGISIPLQCIVDVEFP